MGTSFIVSIGIQLLNVASGVLLARSLGPSGRGALAAALLWPMLLGAIALLGAMEAATFHAARRTASVGTLIGSGLALTAAQSLVFTALAAALLPLVLSGQEPGTLTASFVFLAYIPLNAFTLFLAGVLNGLQQYARFQTVRILVVLLNVLLLGALVVTDELTILNAVLAYLAAATLTLACTLVLVSRETHRLGLDRSIIRRLFGYGIRSHASTVSSQFNERLDQLVISVFLPSSQLGIYVVAVTLTSATFLVGGSVAWVALPQIAPLEPGPERTALARRFFQATLLVSLAVSVPVAVLADPMVELFFGSAFAPAADVSRVLLLAVIILSSNRVLEAILRAVNRPLDAGLAELLALGVTFVGLASLLPLLDLFGAAAASLLAYGVSGLWMTRRLASRLGIPARSVVFIRRADIAWMVAQLRAAMARFPRPAGKG